MKNTAGLLAILMGLWSSPGLAQTAEELLDDAQTPGDVLIHSMGYDRKSYSPLDQIDKSNIHRLVPIWNASLMNLSGELAAPAIYDGVLYAINGSWTFAIDLETGRQIWRTPVVLEEGSRRRSSFNRGGPVIYEGRLFRVTVDNHVLALDMETGEELWNQKFADGAQGYYATGAPDRGQRGPDLGDVRRRVHDPRLPRRLGSGHRREAVAPSHDPGARRARPRDLASRQRRLDVRRGADVALGFVRSRARPRLLGDRQRRAVRPGAAGGAGQPVRVERARHPPEDGRDPLPLPVHPQRRVRRGRHRRARAHRAGGRRRDAQGDDPGQQERLSVHARPYRLLADRRATPMPTSTGPRTSTWRPAGPR